MVYKQLLNRAVETMTPEEQRTCEIFVHCGIIEYHNGRYYPTKIGKKVAKEYRKCGSLEKLFEKHC